MNELLFLCHRSPVLETLELWLLPSVCALANTVIKPLKASHASCRPSLPMTLANFSPLCGSSRLLFDPTLSQGTVPLGEALLNETGRSLCVRFWMNESRHAGRISTESTPGGRETLWENNWPTSGSGFKGTNTSGRNARSVRVRVRLLGLSCFPFLILQFSCFLIV